VRSQVQFEVTNTNHSKIIGEKIQAQNMSIRDIEKNAEVFINHKKVFIMCKRGNASKEATELVLNSEVFGGVTNVYNI
jgi:hypothetical protein